MLKYVDTRRKAMEGFAQHRFRCSLCHRRHVRDLVNTSCDLFCVLASSEGDCQQKLRYILSSCWHERVWSTQVEMHFVSFWQGMGLVKRRFEFSLA